MKISKERKDLEKDLIFYLRYIKAISPDSREKFDLIIQEIVEKFKKNVTLKENNKTSL
jgi:hypothetical protein